MAPEATHSPEGRTLARTYLVEAPIDEGGMGAVYRVRHLRTGGAMAVKLLHREALANPDMYRRFQEEARITSGLRHPNIVQIVDFDQDEDGTPFMIMELLEGENLYQRLKRAGTMPLAEVLEMARHVGSALQAAHESGVVHRDVKPQNIFFARHHVAGEIIEEVKVVDFGLSKIRTAASQQTKEQIIAGTPYYMAPEVARGRSAQLDGRADQFSLAVVIYRALLGCLPFDDDDVMAVLDKVQNEQPLPLSLCLPGLPPHVSAAVERAMSKGREGRYASMADFIRALTGQPSLSGSRGVHGSKPSLPTVRIAALAAVEPAAPSSVDTSVSAPSRTLTGATGQFVQRSQPSLVTGRWLPAALLAMLGASLLIAALWRAAPRPAPAAPAAIAPPALAPVAPAPPPAPDLSPPGPEAMQAEEPEVLPARPTRKRPRRRAPRELPALREPQWNR